MQSLVREKVSVASRLSDLRQPRLEGPCRTRRIDTQCKSVGQFGEVMEAGSHDSKSRRAWCRGMPRQHPAEIKLNHWLAETSEVQALGPCRCSAIGPGTPLDRIYMAEARHVTARSLLRSAPFNSRDLGPWHHPRYQGPTTGDCPVPLALGAFFATGLQANVWLARLCSRKVSFGQAVWPLPIAS